MFLRSAALACTAIALFALAPANANTSHRDATCETTTFRVYFDHNSAALSPTAIETINLAARQVEGCAYRELHVSVDASSPYAGQRGQAILVAARAGDWNVANVEPRAMMRVAHVTGPEFAEVTMTPDMMPAVAPPPATNAGV
ncbi:MAG: hypothetical protein ABUS48_04975 [Pseudomonadota bacterium]